MKYVTIQTGEMKNDLWYFFKQQEGQIYFWFRLFNVSRYLYRDSLAM